MNTNGSHGAPSHRAFIGDPSRYSRLGTLIFNALVLFGLEDDDYLLDIGCGSLRVGKFAIPFLLPGRYYGIEPEQWLIDTAIENEIGDSIIAIKQPVFSNDADFTLSTFGRQFDRILAYSIFEHASRSQISRCLAEAAKVMAPNSIFMATYMSGDKDYTGTEWAYPRRIAYTPETMNRLVEEQDLVCKCIDWLSFAEGPAAGKQRWLAISRRQDTPVDTQLSTLSLPFLAEQVETLKQRLGRVEGDPFYRLGVKVVRLMRRIRRPFSKPGVQQTRRPPNRRR